MTKMKFPPDTSTYNKAIEAMADKNLLSYNTLNCEVTSFIDGYDSAIDDVINRFRGKDDELVSQLLKMKFYKEVSNVPGKNEISSGKLLPYGGN